jgi:hypothetical protein
VARRDQVFVALGLAAPAAGAAIAFAVARITGELD